MDTSEKKEVVKSEIAQREEEILEFWNKNEIFKKTLEKPSNKGEFVFYEGPPTANAAPALHHLEARAFKDVIPRYKTMRGFHVGRKGGWDTHGLPVELQIEKKLGLKSKKEIEQYGIASFNRQCRDSVWEYMELWTRFTDRIGYWVDTHPYVTYHNSYIESLWNILAHVDSKKLLYKDYKVVPWCPRCGTGLSSHELAQGYADITDISVYVKFKIKGQENTYVVAWTTTPWTLPGNVGLAVGGDIDYVKVNVKDEILIFAKERLSVLGDESYTIIEEIKGAQLVGLEYEPLYPYLSQLATGEAKEKLPHAFKIYPADFVTTTDGTGIVHTAVMYGQEDFELGTKVDLPKYHLVGDSGHFIKDTGFLSGRYVREVNENGKPTLAVDIIDDLKKRNLFFKQENIKHQYPHCWRCKTPLIYYARDSWYIRMSSLRKELQKENGEVHWEPSHIQDGRFGEWLREAKDWAISRERYWGTPLPVWTDEHGETVVIDSIQTLISHTKKSGNTYIGMRHGEADHNILGVWSSKAETPHHLTEAGKKQVQDSVTVLSEMLKGKTIDHVYVSPFLRTQETLRILQESFHVPPESIHVDTRLGEWNVGSFDGTPMGDYFAIRKESDDAYTFAQGGAESYRDIVRRSGECIYDLEQKHHGETILIISHGAVLRALNFISHGISRENEEKFRVKFTNFSCAEVRTIDFTPLPHNEYYELDLHRPYIDEIELVSLAGKKMTRVKEVMDVWFDSGAMPFAQNHYPFGETNLLYPADFISEAIDQTRGWFYTLLCVGILMDRGTPYKNVICLGHILDKEGKKMSKSIGNILNPWEMMDRYGVDALRLWMYSVNQPGDSKNFDEKTVDEIIKKIFNPLTNIYQLYATYEGGVSRIDPRTAENALDVWIITRLDNVLSESTRHLDNFKLFEPVRLLRDFIQDFSTWYVRRSRDRFKSKDPHEVSEAVSVTEYVLLELSKFLAPFAPFYAESLYQDMTKGTGKESVHLEEWASVKNTTNNESMHLILQNMQVVRDVVSKALELRQKAGIKVRQPLALLSIPQDVPQEYLEIIRDEINVKEVKNSSGEMHLDTVITSELRDEGVVRDIIRGIQDARKQENLEPSTPIELIVCAPDEIQTLMTQYSTMVVEPTLTTRVMYVSETQKYTIAIEGKSISLSITY